MQSVIGGTYIRRAQNLLNKRTPTVSILRLIGCLCNIIHEYFYCEKMIVSFEENGETTRGKEGLCQEMYCNLDVKPPLSLSLSLCFECQ